MSPRRLFLFFAALVSVAGHAATYRVGIEARNVDALAAHFEAMGWDVAGHDHRGGRLDVVTSSPQAVERERSRLAHDPKLGFRIVDKERSRPLDAATDDLGGYFDADKSAQALRELEARYPQWAKVYDLNEWLGLARTVEGRPLLALQVSARPERLEDEPKALMIGQHHAREVTTHHTVLDAAADLLEGAARGDAEAKAWVEQSAVWFVPVVNPDGLSHVFTTDNMWRKNRAENEDGTRGVDLNRNYEFKWGSCGNHSAEGGSPIYKGPEPFSEPETRVMDKLNDRLRAQYLLSFHSYGNEVLYPYLCGNLAEQAVYHDLRDRLATTLNYATRLASSSGEDFEHHYARYGTLAFLLEMGTNFQPSFSTYRQRLWPTVKKALPFVLREMQKSFVHLRVRESGSGRALPARLSIREIVMQEGETRTADSFGSYRWRLPVGRYHVEARLDGYRTVSIPIDVDGSIQTVDVELTPAETGLVRVDEWLWGRVRAGL